MKTPAGIRSSLMLVVALSVVPAYAATQSVTRVSTATTPITTADELEARAASLHDQLGRYSEAARLCKESAALRAANDPRAIASLVTAAHLYNYANRLFDARKTMEQAAQRALSLGDVERAAVANLEAALFAHKNGRIAEAERLGRIALRLAQSPLLDDAQRGAIVGRLRSTPSIATLVD